jgi:superfamily I DNA and/or RNA helicase
VSLANALAVSMAAPSLILLGDPQQLAQPSQGAHPPGAGVSALEHVLGGERTMPDDRGIFIERTWRMHPDLCAYTSEIFYEDRLVGVEGLDAQAMLGDGPLSGSGLRVLDIDHVGNTNSSPEEAVAVGEAIVDLFTRQWRDLMGERHAMNQRDVLVVTPFNAQIREIDEALEGRGIEGIAVGTVDRFQGRQAPAVIYSMASSTAEDAPRGMQFLYDLHRLNVATSRAQALAILVASPDLVRVFCRTPDQMVLANALCRLRERARP